MILTVLLALLLVAALVAAVTGWGRYTDLRQRYQSAMVELDTADEIAQTHLARAERAEAAIGDAVQRAETAELQAARAFANLKHVVMQVPTQGPDLSNADPDDTDTAADLEPAAAATGAEGGDQ